MEEEKKVVSIEDRIPKLKQVRKKKANRRLVQYLTILFLLIAIVVYLQSPLSHIRNVAIEGEKHVEAGEIRELSGLTENTNFWKVDPEKVEGKIASHNQITGVEVSRELPSTVHIKVEEAERIGYVQVNGQYQPILENGTRLDVEMNVPGGDAPILKGFTKLTYLKEMSKELKELPNSVARLISEIHWTPEEDNPYLITLYMNDGYEVQASLRTFSSKMPAYPSIVSQLSEDQEGIIHIDVGTYFEAYPAEENKEESAEVNDDENQE
ncbi:cell division protein FtsQ/DivIB [Halobacillus amylolyticus]|uniref:Cell division protein DivIB n=1 Tax=Halobacillus amylolyticus TaxID=2932259 RepID=A0ABY4HDG7_9BACI|nr:cell division protein FtsQ/DivIB [Halobacillus amylolyticus]UOR12924.1 cell division protein FtsQ/DivIB [Halobacillus amylolyticus]